MHEVSDQLYNGEAREQFLVRLHRLTDRAIELKKIIYDDAATWCVAQGVDLKHAEALAIKQFQQLRDA